MVETKFEEPEIVDSLCKSSQEFNNFYQKERKKHKDKIEWIQETSLTGRNAYADTSINDGIQKCKIYFKRFPDASDAGLIAHEIGHVIRWLDNESLDFNEKNNPNLAQDFRNMIEDPIVDSILIERYKFNLLAWYKKDLMLFKKELDQLNEEPTDKIRELAWMTNLIRLLRCWNLIKNQNDEKEWAEYKATFRVKCPTIWKKSVDFYLFIGTI